MSEIDIDNLTFSFDEVTRLLRLSERHSRRILNAAGIFPTAAGRWPARPVSDLAINRAIGDNPAALAERVRELTERITELEDELRAERKRRRR